MKGLEYASLALASQSALLNLRLNPTDTAISSFNAWNGVRKGDSHVKRVNEGPGSHACQRAADKGD